MHDKNIRQSICDAILEFDPQIQATPKQIECFQHLISGNDVIDNLRIGYNKSVIYQALMGVFQKAQVCEISENVVQSVKKFRFRKEKNVAAILLKIDTETDSVIVDEEFTDMSIEEIKEELPEFQPRFLVLSYVRSHDDGRLSYPLCFIYICPRGYSTKINMMYAGTINALKNKLDIPKEFELSDIEEFTEEWLEKMLR